MLRSALNSALALSLGALAGCGGGEATPDAQPNAQPDAQPGDLGGRKFPLGGVDTGGTGSPMAFYSVALDTVAPVTGGGVLFDTHGCTFVDGDGRSFGVGELEPGMTAQIDARAPTVLTGQTTAQALTLRSAEQLLGSVQAVDLAAGSLTLLGQQVLVNAGTQFDAAFGRGVPALTPGMRVRVWGELDSARGRIVASRIDQPTQHDHDIVRGVLGAIDRTLQRVSVGALVAQGTALPDDVAVGDVVRLTLALEGSGASVGAVGASAVATLLSLRIDALRLPDREQAELEGRVTQFTSMQHFKVDGAAVDATAATSVQGAAALALGARVAVKGRSSAGVLVASSVEVQAEEADAVFELEGRIQSADRNTRSFMLRGISVRWDGSTRFIGGGAALLRAGRSVAVKGRLSADRRMLLASMVHVEA